ncbi:(2Fe-2S)-binding protein [Streptomyces sp. HNM0574]|uniref:(2Fe-2S)-binding protein n=1 Tax=Streptomyces sp. HNM0574 TaxID=2714954 RepID=UPI00146DA33C|nr:(2Fe-2S)-binding protein [Streptomyces sp. HNM0574]
MYVCSCFGVTEQQVREHAESGACTPRQIASASKAGTDCGSCVRRIQGILGRGSCPRREALERGEAPLAPAATAASTAATTERAETAPPVAPVPTPLPAVAAEAA